MSVAPKQASYADLAALPEGVRAEVVGGEVRTAPAPLPEHSRAQGALRRFIGGPYDDDDGRGGPGGWWILLEVDVALGARDIVRPDLAGWRRARLGQPWGKRPLDVVPDWVCEVLSPSNASHDRVTKAELYRASGVGHFWLIDPDQKTLEAFELDAGRWVRLGAWDASATAAVAPFEDTPLELARLFPPSPGG